MPVTANTPSPYAPASAILDLIGRHRSHGLFIRGPVTAEVLGRAGISDSLIPRTLQALQSLDLIDEAGMPTQVFEGIRLAPEAEYKKRLEDWLKGAYADVFSFVDPLKDDETRIRDAFRSYQPVGQQGRMVTLFTGLCTAAGLVAEKKSHRPAASATFTPRQRTVAKRFVAERFKDAPRHPSSLPAPLAGLLENLPAEGDVWTKEEREKFMATFGTVLDFCFPIVENVAAADGDDQKTETPAPVLRRRV